MKKIELVSMKVENFKGIKYREAQFGTETRVSGRNGSGKTSMYEAYLWCLFEKDAEGKSIFVRPLTVDNKVVHKVETSVELVLQVDGVQTTIKRVQKEDWSVPRGEKVARLNGYVTEPYINDVPMKVSDFNAKLDEICNRNDWFMLSSIQAFMGQKTEDRRKKLLSIANLSSDAEIAKDYPHVMQAFNEGKSVDEFSRQIRAEKAKMKKDLDEIPVRIDQQEKLRTNDDYAALEEEANQINTKIADIDSTLTALVSEKDIDRAESQKAELVNINKDLADIENEVKRARDNRIAEYETKKRNAENDIAHYRSDKEQRERHISNSEKVIREKELKFDEKKAAYLAENSKEYQDTIEEVCPTCKRPLPSDEVLAAREKAIRDFNEHKNTVLNELYEDANRIKQDIEDEKSLIEKERQEIARMDIAIKTSQDMVDSANEAIKKVPTVELTLSAKVEYQNLLTKKQEVERQIRILSEPSKTDDEKEQKKANLRTERDQLNTRLREVNTRLGTKGVNENIDKQKAELEKQSSDLAQKIADVEKIEFEIMDFRKKKVTMANDAVSSFFSIVRWKMFESNLTNDGEREICLPLVNGIPLDGQNTAMRVNGSIDIINGLSKASEISVPLFIDGKESVTNLIETNAQLITLVVSADSDLEVSIIKN